MTPKEKAIELIDKFKEPTKVPNVKGIWIEDLDGAKQCALIAVQEVLDLTPIEIFPEFRMFWQSVESEINKIETK